MGLSGWRVISMKMTKHVAKELTRDRSAYLSDAWPWVKESLGGSRGVVKVPDPDARQNR